MKLDDEIFANTLKGGSQPINVLPLTAEAAGASRSPFRERSIVLDADMDPN
jgi:hypothetical protein